MDDCIAAIAVPQAATAYVRPSALVFTVEGGRLALHVTRGRTETLALLAAKRAKTRDERYRMSVEVAESSVLPETSDAPTIAVASNPVLHLMMDAAFEVMPRLDALEKFVHAEDPGLDVFYLPHAPEIQSGFAVVRTHAGPLLEMLHSREQAADFLKRHEAVIGEDMMEECGDDFGRSPLVHRSRRLPEAFGGFAAAVIGARYRFRRALRDRMLKR